MIKELEALVARRGQRIKPRVAKFLQWLKGQQLSAGRGIRLIKSDNGTIIKAAVPKQAFIGAFYVTPVSDNKLIVGRGYVNGIEPTIFGVKISGDDEAPPKLPMPTEFKESRAWVYVEVMIDEKTERIDEEDPEAVKMVTGLTSVTGNKFTGRHPVAMLVKLKDGSIGARQISYFSLRHAFKGNRHFFVPA